MTNLEANTTGLEEVLAMVNALPDDAELVEQATPSISVSSGGLITASATQEAGKVKAGTKSATKQLTVQAAQTITPGTSNKTIASGRYLTGTQTIKGDANLVAGNIKSGVSIFGVAGSLEAGSSGGSSGGDSGGSGTLETCTVTLSAPETGSNMAMVYSTLNNGEIECVQRYMADFYIGMLLGTVVCLKNSFMVLGYPAIAGGTKTPTVTGAIEIISDGKIANSVGAVFKISGDGSIAIA